MILLLLSHAQTKYVKIKQLLVDKSVFVIFVALKMFFEKFLTAWNLDLFYNTFKDILKRV